MICEFPPEAEQEFVEAAAYYERNLTDLGERFGSEVHHAIERLLEYPELGSPIDADLRRLMLTRFPGWGSGRLGVRHELLSYFFSLRN